MTAATSLASGVTTPAKLHLNVLSSSAIACYRACPRKFELSYVKKRRPRRAAEALRFGTLWHCGLNAWWITIGDAGDKFSAAVHAMRARAEKHPDEVDDFDLVKAEELILGYTARWGDEGYETIAVERQFDVPLVNPETNKASTRYRVQGALDVVARLNGAVIHVEHKSTSSDITPGSDYWRKVSALDAQVSTYQAALESVGLPAAETLYDVVRKVALRPSKATPEESRKYKKDGSLYANQREEDETPEEFRERVRAHITEDPTRYYARGPIVRLERDKSEHARDTWQTAAMIRLSENAGSFPRNPGACERFHRLCEYFEVCSGNASIDDDSRFRTAETPHEELVKEV